MHHVLTKNMPASGIIRVNKQMIELKSTHNAYDPGVTSIFARKRKNKNRIHLANRIRRNKKWNEKIVKHANLSFAIKNKITFAKSILKKRFRYFRPQYWYSVKF